MSCSRYFGPTQSKYLAYKFHTETWPRVFGFHKRGLAWGKGLVCLLHGIHRKGPSTCVPPLWASAASLPPHFSNCVFCQAHDLCWFWSFLSCPWSPQAFAHHRVCASPSTRSTLPVLALSKTDLKTPRWPYFCSEPSLPSSGPPQAFCRVLPQSVLQIGLCCSVAQSCPTLCNCSTPGFPTLHHLPESAQTHVHWVSDAIQPSHPLSSPSPPAFNLSQHQGLF